MKRFFLIANTIFFYLLGVWYFCAPKQWLVMYSFESYIWLRTVGALVVVGGTVSLLMLLTKHRNSWMLGFNVLTLFHAALFLSLVFPSIGGFQPPILLLAYLIGGIVSYFFSSDECTLLAKQAKTKSKRKIHLK